MVLGSSPVAVTSDDVQFLRHGAQQTDRQMDRQEKRQREVGAPPNENCTGAMTTAKNEVFIGL